MLEAEDIRHSREIYSLFDILGDLGGVTEVIMLLFGFFLFPISEHSFSLQALKRLYKARTIDNSIFKKSPEELEEEKEKQRLKQYEEPSPDDPDEGFSIQKLKQAAQFKNIKISFKDSLLLYFSNYFGLFYTKGCWNKKKKLQKLLDVGNDKIDGELDVVNIMNDLRNLKIMLTFSIMTRKVREKIQYTGKNIIDLDTSSSESDIAGDENDEESKKPVKQEIGLKDLFDGWKRVVEESKKKEHSPKYEISLRDDSITHVNLPVSAKKKTKSLSIRREEDEYGEFNGIVKNNKPSVNEQNFFAKEPSMVFHESVKIRANESPDNFKWQENFEKSPAQDGPLLPDHDKGRNVSINVNIVSSSSNQQININHGKNT